MDLNFNDEDFRERVRQMLRGRAPGQFRFCDDHDSENPTEAPQLPPRVITNVLNSNLISYGFLASTEDNPDQGVEMTVKDDANFWSSTGSPHDVGEEFLLYKLKHPFSCVRAVEVQVYRAAFQGGGPIYPAKQVLIEVGHSPSTMRTVGGPYIMACTDMPQTFLLPPSLDSCAVGSYAAIRFQGKYQKQHFDDSYYLSMRYVRVLGNPCEPHEALSMRSWIARPFPPADVLGPASCPPSLALSLDTELGSALSPDPQQQVSSQDTSTCVIEIPSWAQHDILRALCNSSKPEGGRGVGTRQIEDKVFGRCSGERAPAQVSSLLMQSATDCIASRSAPLSPENTAHASSTSHASSAFGSHALGFGCEQAPCSLPFSLDSRRRQRWSPTAGLLDRMLVRGLAPKLQGACSRSTSICANEDEARSLSPVDAIWTHDGEMTMQHGQLNSHPLQHGPLQHSVDEQGLLRCIIWARRHDVAMLQRSCEGADDSEVEAPRAVAGRHAPHAPLFVRNRLPSCISNNIQLVGARKRAASSTGIGSPLKAARESSSTAGACTVSDVHCMLFGQVQAVPYAVPFD